MECYQTRFFRWSTLLICSAVIGLAGCAKDGQRAEGSKPPTSVEVVTLQPTETQLTDTLPGRVSAYRTAEIRPQVNGIVVQRFFEEGTTVEAGDPLYQIDAATYRAELESARGELAVAEADAYDARLRAERYGELVKTNAISRQEADDADAAWKSARAAVEAAKAQVRRAEIDLEYTSLSAPIAGIIGRSTITEGALVSARQETALATIHQLSPVFVDIQRPATAVLKMKQRATRVPPKVSLTLEDGTPYDETGTLQFSEVSVNQGTGTVNVRAKFENKNGLLLPGLFVRATIISENLRRAILAPQEGISRQRDGSATALVVNSDNVVENRAVEVDRAIDDNWLVKSGLGSGDKLIVSGLQKVQPGAKVNPVERDRSIAAADSQP